MVACLGRFCGFLCIVGASRTVVVACLVDGRSITPRTELGIFRNLISAAVRRRYSVIFLPCGAASRGTLDFPAPVSCRPTSSGSLCESGLLETHCYARPSDRRNSTLSECPASISCGPTKRGLIRSNEIPTHTSAERFHVANRTGMLRLVGSSEQWGKLRDIQKCAPRQLLVIRGSSMRQNLIRPDEVGPHGAGRPELRFGQVACVRLSSCTQFCVGAPRQVHFVRLFWLVHIS